MTDVRDLASARFLEPAEVAILFRRLKKKDNIEKVKDEESGEDTEIVHWREGDPDVQWVYNNAAPAKGLRKAGFLSPAARRFNEKTLLFDRAEVERIIAAANNSAIR